MATTVSDVVAEAVSTLGGRSATQEFVDLSTQLQRLTAINQSTVEVLQANTQALERSRSSSAPSGSGIADGLRTFGSFIGISPIITGLARLFDGGDDEPAAPAFSRFTLPPRFDVTAGQGNDLGSPFAVSPGQGNMPRAVTNTPVTIQIQALDSQSILDRSQDIARAVRLAMLETGVLSDVIREV